jgi:predicted O-methyltransferase YrrM
MAQETWTKTDDYLSQLLIGKDAVLEQALHASNAAGLPQIYVTPTQGMFLHLLARMQSARKILEIGTLGGYSTIWLVRALPKDGKLVTLEADPRHAEVAKNNIQKAGLSDLVEIRIGKALETMRSLLEEGVGPFDFIFIDADKPPYPEYLEWSLKLSHPGTVIIGDNVIRGGEIVDRTSSDERVNGVRRFIELMAENPRLSATVIQTVGSKGYDGFAMAIVND